MLTLTDIQFVVIGLVMFSAFFLYLICVLAYWLKVVRKIDNILASHGNPPENFDIFWGRTMLYMHGTFWPKHFVKSGRKEKLFDPFLFIGSVTYFDKFLMVSQWVFLILFFTLLSFFSIFVEI
ncbi:hypothetical protein CYL31_01345 [Marinomonas sp. A3A]|jgi:hypothetical protein|uniref:hypothetical protein n=1 Tax=Marinomonas sp. A3A TaxID=2065312 RepID=UPI001BB31305|nr:hypothetical protein [Marinomonas sp. A3A]QUX90123.1 hypothetical protein CYL31_01345 [Marinomonas sp. A3A]